MESYTPHGDTFADLKATFRADKIKEQRASSQSGFFLVLWQGIGRNVEAEIPPCHLPITWRT